MTGYYRINRAAVWHLFVPMNDFMMAASCERPILYNRAAIRSVLKQRAELPTNARICKDCEKRAA
jgi:hypothetical protein